MASFDISQIKISRSRRASLSIKVLYDGSISVRAPYLIPKKFIENFVKSKREWIEKQQSILSKNRIKPKKFEDGEIFPYFGKDYFLRLDSSIASITLEGDNLLFPLALVRRGKEVMEKWYSKKAREEIRKIVDEYSQKMDTTYNGITFSDTRSQWGRCTSDNRLQFNWRLIMSPLIVVRYVVIHELAHTKEKNHSARFWSLVRKYNPSYKQQIKWLKEHGYSLRFD